MRIPLPPAPQENQSFRTRINMHDTQKRTQLHMQDSRNNNKNKNSLKSSIGCLVNGIKIKNLSEQGSLRDDNIRTEILMITDSSLSVPSPTNHLIRAIELLH